MLIGSKMNLKNSRKSSTNKENPKDLKKKSMNIERNMLLLLNLKVNKFPIHSLSGRILISQII